MKEVTINGIKYLNSQCYSECQIVSAINASRYFGDSKDVVPQSSFYEQLVDLGRARYGAACSMNKVFNALKLKRTPVIQNKRNMISALSRSIPISFTIWHEQYGFHDVLIIDFNKEKNEVTVLNLSKCTDSNCVIKWDMFKKLFPKNHTRKAYKYNGRKNSGR